MGSGFLCGVGVNLSIVGACPRLMGLGNRPLLPCRCLRCHIARTLTNPSFIQILVSTFVQYVNSLSVSSSTHSKACLAAFLAMFSNSVNGPSLCFSFSRCASRFLISSSVLTFFFSKAFTVLLMTYVKRNSYIFLCIITIIKYVH